MIRSIVKMKKKLLSLIVVLCLLISAFGVIYAGAEPTSSEEGISSEPPSFVGCEHSWVDNTTAVVGKHCELCNADYCAVMGHEENTPATCTKLAECKICEKEYGELKEHTLPEDENSDCAEEVRCEVCSALIKSAGQHDWSPATCTTQKTCQVCGVTEGDVLMHHWGKGTVTKQPTKNNDGSIRYVCEDCGQIKNQTIYFAEGEDNSSSDVVFIIIIIIVAIAAIGAIVYFVFIRRKR